MNLTSGYIFAVSYETFQTDLTTTGGNVEIVQLFWTHTQVSMNLKNIVNWFSKHYSISMQVFIMIVLMTDSVILI